MNVITPRDRKIGAIPGRDPNKKYPAPKTGMIELQVVYGLPNINWKDLFPGADMTLSAELLNYHAGTEQWIHHHTTAQVLVMLEGKLYLTRAADMKEWEVHPGTIWTTEKDEKYRFRTGPDSNAIFITIRPGPADTVWAKGTGPNYMPSAQ